MILALCLSAIPTGAQAPPASEAPKDLGIRESLEVRLVEAPILALSRGGQPIVDLEAKDIVVSERGKRLAVAFLEPFDRQGGVDVPEGARLHVDAPGGWEGVQVSHGREPRYVALLVDADNDYKLRKPEAVKAVQEFLKTRLRPEDHVAVLSSNETLTVEVPFTDDRAALLSGIDLAFARPPAPRIDVDKRIRDLIDKLEDCPTSGSRIPEADRSCVLDSGREYADERRPEARSFLATLDAASRLLAGLKGRKMILVFSHGVASDPSREIGEAMRAALGNTEQVAQLELEFAAGEGARDELDRLIAEAGRGGVTFHFIDRAEISSTDFGARQGRALQPGTRPLQVAFDIPRVELAEIATATGGTFTASSDLSRSMAGAFEMDRGGYLLGYYADAPGSSGKRGGAQVSTTRKGVKIRFGRQRFPNEDSVGGSIEGSMRAGAPSPSKVAGPALIHTAFEIKFAPAAIGYQLVDDEARANFTLHVVVLSKDGRSIVDSYHFVNHAYPRPIWESGTVAPVLIHGWTDLPPGEYLLFARIRNTDNGRKGEVSVPLSIRAHGAVPSSK